MPRRSELLIPALQACRVPAVALLRCCSKNNLLLPVLLDKLVFCFSDFFNPVCDRGGHHQKRSVAVAGFAKAMQDIHELLDGVSHVRPVVDTPVGHPMSASWHLEQGLL